MSLSDLVPPPPKADPPSPLPTDPQAPHHPASDISPQDWARWRHHPVTRVFLAFLADFHLKTGQTIPALVESGSLTKPEDLALLRGRLAVMREMHDLDLASVHRFYGIEPPQDAEGQ